MSTNKKMWKYNPIVRDLSTNKYAQRIKRQKSPYDDDNYDIQLELMELDNLENINDDDTETLLRKFKIKIAATSAGPGLPQHPPAPRAPPPRRALVLDIGQRAWGLADADTKAILRLFLVSDQYWRGS